MAKSPTLAVVIPMYNELDMIEACLDALLEQAEPLEEIIVVNNNSTDGCDDLVRQNYSQVTLLDEPQQGIVYARNRGFDHAKTDIIAKIDVDTRVLRGWSRRMKADFRKHSCDAWSGAVGSYEVNRRIAPVTGWFFNNYLFRLNHLVAGHRMLFGSNLALTKQMWRRVKPKLLMRNDIWEDLDVASQVASVGGTTFITMDRLVQISLRSANEGFKVFSRRAYGMCRVYWLRKKYISYALSLPFLVLSVATWLILRPLSFIGQNISKRPKSDQY